MEDPEQLAIACIPLLRYAEAFAAHKRASKVELKAWQGSQMMALVERHEFEAVAEELGEGE